MKPFKEMQLEELRSYHSDMLATASDLSIDAPDHLCVEFGDRAGGIKICSELHELIQEKRKQPARAKQKEAPMAKKAKKAASKKTATKKFAPEAKIKVLVKENPCRKGTGRHDRVAKLLKSNGKTVAASGVKSGTLKYAVEAGWIKVG